MHMHSCGHQTEASKTIKTFWGCFIYNMVIYWIAILFIGITFLYRQRWVKVTNETTTLFNPFRLQHNFILINKLSHGHNFSLVASAFLVEDFAQTNVLAHVCLDMHQS